MNQPPLTRTLVIGLSTIHLDYIRMSFFHDYDRIKANLAVNLHRNEEVMFMVWGCQTAGWRYDKIIVVGRPDMNQRTIDEFVHKQLYRCLREPDRSNLYIL